MNYHIFSGWEFSNEEKIVFAAGLIITSIVLLAGIFFIAREIIRAVKMYIKGTKKVRKGMLSRTAILVSIVLATIIFLNLTAQ